MIRLRPIAVSALFAALPAAAPAEAASCGGYRGQIMNHEVGGCAWSENCYARLRSSSALGCYQMTRAALVDAGLKTRSGRWLPNRWNIASARQFAENIEAQNYALDHYTALNWERLGPGVRGLAGTSLNGARITEGGLLSAAHFLGPGGLREFASCGFRPDCVPPEAAAANGGRENAWRIAMGRLAEGSTANLGPLTGTHTPGGGGRFSGFGAAPPLPAGAFPPWAAAVSREQPPLQGERRSLR